MACDQQVRDLLSAQGSVCGDQHIQHALVRTADLGKGEIPIADRLVVHRHDVSTFPVIQPIPRTLALWFEIWRLPVAVRHAREVYSMYEGLFHWVLGRIPHRHILGGESDGVIVVLNDISDATYSPLRLR